MQRILWVLLCGIFVVLMATACPREQKPADTPDSPDINIDVKTDDTSTDTSTDSTKADTDQSSSTAADGTATDATTPPADASTPPADATTPPADTPPAAGTTTVVLVTTKGDIEIEVHPEWSPLGAAHFLELVNAKFYDGAPWFRVLDGFVAQAGVAADPAMNSTWGPKTIQDEPVVQGNKPGYVAFGKSQMPNSRSTHIFINTNDNTGSLDPQGFACFAVVTSGMDNVMKLEKVEYADQGGLGAPGGMAAFKQAFPTADYITKAYVKK
jgi:cyclophilin family peptidyl-prolyl cis-trans isomerase